MIKCQVYCLKQRWFWQITSGLKKNNTSQHNLDVYILRFKKKKMRGGREEHMRGIFELICSIDTIEPTVYLQWFLKVSSLNTHQYSSNYLVYLMMPHLISSSDKEWLFRGHGLVSCTRENSTCKQFLDLKRLNIYITAVRAAWSCIALCNQKHISLACKEDRKLLWCKCAFRKWELKTLI